jgi:predicted transcriptional regulator of viral defense system
MYSKNDPKDEASYRGMRTKESNSKAETRAIALFVSHQGILRSKDAKKLGIHPRMIHALVESGKIEKLARGLYALPNLPGHAHPDLVTVFAKIPYGVLCLISALFFHNLTTQIPHFIYLAIQQGKKPAVPAGRFSRVIK